MVSSISRTDLISDPETLTKVPQWYHASIMASDGNTVVIYYTVIWYQIYLPRYFQCTSTSEKEV